jgi:microcystin-dependent protein
MGNKRISDYANGTTIASTTEFLAEKADGSYEAIAWSILSSIMPIGGIIMYGGSSTPDNFLLCDGSAKSRTTYSALFAVISTTYGVGDGSTTFNLPNYQAVVPVGTGTQTINTREKTGPALGGVEEDQIQGHEHDIYTYSSGGLSGDRVYGTAYQTQLGTSPTNGIATDGVNGTPRTGTTTRENRIGTNFYIRYQ